MEATLGTSNKALTRRDYFTGCALQALVRTKGVEMPYAKMVDDAIMIGSMVDDQIDGEKEVKEVAAKGKKA